MRYTLLVVNMCLGLLIVSEIAKGQTTVDGRHALVEKYLPDDSAFAIVVDVRGMLDHPIVKRNYLPKLKQFLESQDQASTILNLLALDPLNDVSLVILSGSRIDASGDNMVFVVHGQFAEEHINEVLRTIEQKGGVTRIAARAGLPREYYLVNKSQGNAACFFAMLGKKSLVFSKNQDCVVEVLLKDAGQRTTALKKTLFRDLFANLGASQCLWMGFQGNAIVQDGKTAEQEYGLESLCGGVALADDIKTALSE